MHELENKRPANRSGIPQRRTKSDVMDANPENGLPLQSTHANPVSLNGPSLASGTSERQIFELNVQISALEAKLNEQTAALALKRLSDAQVVKQTKSIHHLETKVAELCSENAKLKQVKENAVPDSSAAETLITRLNLVQDEADDMSQQILDLSVSLKNKSATIARYETEAQAARKELTKAVNYVTGLKQQLNEASEKEEVMQSSLNAAAESESECLRLKALLADLQGQNARNDAAVSKELASLRSSNAVLSEQLEAAKAAQGIVDLESQAKQLSRISDLEKQVCDFESSVTPLAAAFEAAKAELLKQADLATEKDDKIIALQLSLTQKEFQNSASTTRKLDAEKAELQAHLNQLAAAFEAANGELEMKTVECSVAAGENIPNAVKIAEHIPIIQDLKEEIEAYEAVIARGKEEFKLLRAKLEEAQSGGGPSPLQQQMWEADKLKVVELDALVVSLRAQLQSASAQFSEYNSKVDDLNARETELAEASKNAAKALLEKETKIEDLTEQLTLSEDAYDRLKLQVDTELLVKMASLQTEVANFQVVVKQMEERLQTATAENISRADLDAALKRCEGLDSEKRDVLSEIAALEVSTAQKIEQAKQEMALVVQENNKNALMANNLTLEAENAAAKIAQQGLGLCEANAVIDNLTVSNTALEAERHLLNASLELQIATIAEHFDTIQAFQAEIAMFKRDHARSFAFCSKQISSLHELWELFGCTSSLVEFGEVGSLRLAEEQFDTLLQEMTPMIRTKHDSLLLSEKKLLADIEAIVCQLEHAQAEHKQVIAELEKLRSQSEQEKIQHASIDHSELSSLRNEHESVLETLAGKLDEVALFEQALMLAQNRIQEQEDRHNLDIKNLEELNFRILEADQRVKALEAERLELESDSEQRDNAAQELLEGCGTLKSTITELEALVLSERESNGVLLQEVQVLKDSAQDNHKSAESAVAAINADLEKAKLEHGSAVAKLAQFEIQYESDLQKARDSVEDFKLEKAEAIAELTIKLVILNTQLKSLTEEHNQALIKLQVSEEMLAKLRDTECQLNNQKSEYALGLESKVAEMEAQLEAKATQMHGIEVAAEEKAANNEKQLASANASLSGLQEQLLVQQNKPIQNSETNTDSFVLSDQGCNTDLVSLCHMETSTHATVMQDASIEVQLDLECIKEIFDGKLNVAESVQDPLIVTNLEVSLAEQQEKNTALSRDAKAKSQQLDDMTVKYLDAAKERESLKNRLQALKATLSERASPIVTLATTPKSNENEKLASNTLVDTSTALPEISKYKRRRPSDAGLEGQASRPKTDSPKPESKTIFSPQISKLAANLIPRWATRKAPEADTQQSDDRLKEQLDQQKKKSNSKVDKDSDCNQQ